MNYSSTLKSELKKLEELSQRSGDQTVEELRAVRQMFEQSEESKTASEYTSELSMYNPRTVCVSCR